MGKKLFFAALLSLALPARAAARGTAPLVFKIPDGWTDLSRDAPAENFRGVPPSLRAQSRQVALLAMDLKGAADGFAENLNVRMMRCPSGPYDERILRALAKAAGEKGKKPGLEVTMLGKRLVEIGGVKAARFVLRTKMKQGGQEVDMKQVQYHLPGGERCAIATYTAAVDTFDRYEATFDASARATTGLKTPPKRGLFARIGKSAFRGAIIGGVSGMIAVLLVGLFRRKKKSGEGGGA